MSQDTVIKESEVIGSGTYGIVSKMVLKDGSRFAAKVFKKKGDGISIDTIKEIVILRDMRESKAIVNIHGIYADGLTGEGKLILELGEKSLSAYIKETTWRQRRKIFPAVFKSCMMMLSDLFKYQVVHYDIKPGNILIMSTKTGKCKLCDFGLATYTSSYYEKTYRRAFTKWYRPPEYNCGKTRRLYFSGDLWSMGLSILQYIIGKPLFRPKNTDDHFKCLMKVPKCGNVTRSVLKKAFNYGCCRGGIDVRKILNKYKGVKENVIKILESFLSFDPEKRFDGVFWTIGTPLTRELPFFSSVTPGEKIVHDKLYNKTYSSFRQYSESTSYMRAIEAENEALRSSSIGFFKKPYLKIERLS